MEKDKKIVYGDIEITQGSKFEQLEQSIMSLGIEILWLGRAEREKDFDTLETHQHIVGLQTKIKEELKKFSFEDASKYLSARTQYWKNFDASKQNQFPGALNVDKIPQTLATQKARSIAREVAKPQSPESQK